MRSQIYCSVCGAPMGSTKEWLSESNLLTTAYEVAGELKLDRYRQSYGESAYSFKLGRQSPADCVRHVLCLDALTDDGTAFQIQSTGEKIIPMQINEDSKTRDGYLYMPIHRSCLAMADRLIDSAPPTSYPCPPQHGTRITSRITLWEVIFRRLPGDINASPHMIPEPHDYFGGDGYRNVDYEPCDDVQFSELHEAHPLEIPKITNSILRNLKPFDASNDILQSTCEQDPALNVSNIQDMDLTCDYIQSQSWWCSVLYNKQAFPWLWDLDVEAIRAKESEGSWNWELLVRQMSQVSIHEPDDASIDLPKGLRNRRRIWRLLAEARVGDIEDVEEPRLVAAWARRFAGEED